MRTYGKQTKHEDFLALAFALGAPEHAVPSAAVPCGALMVSGWLRAVPAFTLLGTEVRPLLLTQQPPAQVTLHSFK